MSANHPLFPVTMDAEWLEPSSVELDSTLMSWLIEPSSLTARLRSNANQFRVSVLGQRIESCREEEASADIKAGEQVLVREVLLFCDDVPHVFARSLLPLNSLTGEQQGLANIGDQSLGQILFNHPHLIRKNIEIASFEQHASLSPLLTSLSMSHTDKLWGRRSVFVIDNKPMMVAEVFLPKALAYQQSKVTA